MCSKPLRLTGKSLITLRATADTARTATTSAGSITGIGLWSTSSWSDSDKLRCFHETRSSGGSNGDKVLSTSHLGLYRSWQRDYTRQVKMPAMPVQNQTSDTLGAGSATPDAQVPA